MPSTDVAAVAMSASGHDFSILALVLQADPIVKGVMLILVLASIGCWTVIIDRSMRLLRARREVAAFEALARSGKAFTAGVVQGLPAAILEAGLSEWRDDAGPEQAVESRAERRRRIEQAMHAAMASGLRRLEPGLPFLATVGSAAPFIGLFGTVWGIMNSFTSIARAQDTSLAVVAPGIAEALFATAIGLAAAIPAVIAYNKLATELGRLAQRLGAVIGQLGRDMSGGRLASIVRAAE